MQRVSCDISEIEILVTMAFRRFTPRLNALFGFVRLFSRMRRE